ncbi:TIGR01777 family oxidoreductase [Mucilaginibacter sp. Bleaf8]|uniref:TIGR01777 family oxidoreductase n=1 Tax=Mucilaginibacter sp. Bleaf8 TaxID=2834430 RepID=UPI001BCFDFA5|nr:TIGR01777 family oxidoreductase [Mucilaginibacter sp. Bleaf8]MBS7564295.1 TIGR01777 family oxidoreductase [Mucilaginibacter sp. Bleaf8]
MPKQHILITGGSGLIGKTLTQELLQRGYQVSHLSRTPGTNPQVQTYLWNVQQKRIDEACINGVDTIIHLAGAGIADKRWTNERKKLLIDSRTESIRLIYDLLKKHPHQVKNIISASATGYYSNRGNELLTEDSYPAHDFLGTCCIEWEKAVDEGQHLGLNITKFRTGVVLTKQGGALPQLALPVKLGAGSALGNGQQWIPWIHWQDVVDMYLYAIDGHCPPGVYNMVAPNPVTNLQLTVAVAKQLNRPLWLPKVPAFVLKLIFGEMSLVVLGSTRVSATKIEQAGFTFRYPIVTDALKDIYG